MTEKIDRLVSIIIPIYNVKEYIKNTVSSVALQTYKNIEIILVDDGSHDGSAEVCDELCKEDTRIKVIHKANGGLSSARNAGLNIAAGNFVMFLDGDDYLALNAVEYLADLQYITNADMIQFGYEETSCEYTENVVKLSNKYVLETEQKRFFEKLYGIGGEAASACTKFYKISLFDDLHFKEGILHEDEFLVTRLLTKIDKIAYIPDKLYYYVMRNNSIIRSVFNIKKLDFFRVSADRIEKLENMGYTDLLTVEYFKYFSGLMNYFCNAAISSNKEGCAEIIKLIGDFYNKYHYAPKGKMMLFYLLCRINPRGVYIYYILRRIFGHIE